MNYIAPKLMHTNFRLIIIPFHPTFFNINRDNSRSFFSETVLYWHGIMEYNRKKIFFNMLFKLEWYFTSQKLHKVQIHDAKSTSLCILLNFCAEPRKTFFSSWFSTSVSWVLCAVFFKSITHPAFRDWLVLHWHCNSYLLILCLTPRIYGLERAAS